MKKAATFQHNSNAFLRLELWKSWCKGWGVPARQNRGPKSTKPPNSGDQMKKSKQKLK